MMSNYSYDNLRRLAGKKLSAYQQLLMDTAPKGRPSNDIVNQITNNLRYGKQSASKVYNAGKSAYKQFLTDTARNVKSQEAVNKIVRALEQGQQTVGNKAQALNNLYKTKVTPQQAEAIVNKAVGAGKNIVKSPVGKSIGYLPYIGDAYDIGFGLYEATHGHPYAGGGQALWGAGTLAADLLSGGLAGAGAKGIGKAALRYLKPLTTTKGRLAGIALPWLGYIGGEGKEEVPADTTTPPQAGTGEVPTTQTTTLQNIPTPNYSYSGGGGGNDGIAGIIAREIGEYQQPTMGDTPQVDIPSQQMQPVSTQQPIEGQQPQQVEQPSIDYSKALLEALQRQEALNAQGYMKDLRNYRRQLPLATATDYLTKKANAYYARALDNPYLANVGAPGAVDVANAYPTIGKEQANVANQLLANNLSRYANMQAASDAGISPLSGLGDNRMLQQLGGIRKAETSAGAKQYSADKYYQGRQLASATQLQIQNLKNAIAMKLLDRSLSTKERMQLRELNTRLNIAEQRNATNLELGRMGALSRPYTMGMGLSPEYAGLYGVSIPQAIQPAGGGLSPEVLQSLLGR